MIERLRGTVHKLQPGKLSVDVADVGYMVSVPMDTWETAPDGASTTLYISPYIREDRFELYGFLDQAGRSLFEGSPALHIEKPNRKKPDVFCGQ